MDINGLDAISIAVNAANADIVTLLRLAKLNEEIKESELGNPGKDYQAVRLFVRLLARPSTHPSGHMSVHLSVCSATCPSVYPPIYPFFSSRALAEILDAGRFRKIVPAITHAK